ncbi:MAG: CvpA family protein [Clostridia bacterium]|nr:CvpA family protein [Clostridia bacterium]
MNLIDYVILFVLGFSVLMGIYRGFVSTVLNVGGGLAAFGLSFALYPKLAAAIAANGDLVRTLLHYTDASRRIGDLEMAIANVSTLTAERIAQIVEKVHLPAPLDTLLQVNLTGRVYTPSGLSGVSDYVSQTILSASINILCFLVCFAVLYFLISCVINMLRAVFRFPLLKRLDWLAGAVFGFARGVLICYALFTVVPLV